MNNLKITGEYEFYKGGEIIDGRLTGGELVAKHHNLITTSVYEMILKNITGESQDDLNLNYFVFGTGTTAATESDTQLETEFFRKAYTSKSWTGKQFTAICQLGVDEANTTITEVGVVANGTATEDTGTLLSHAIFTIEKNSNIVYNVIYRLTLSEV